MGEFAHGLQEWFTPSLLNLGSLKDGAFFQATHEQTATLVAGKEYGDCTRTPCLHAGLSTDYGEVIWNEVYRVPSDVNDDVCDYPLARNLVMLTVATVCEVILQRRGFANVSFVATGEQRHFTITLKDLSIQSLNL
ncbi:MAG: hypothetical protein KME16_27660 [Scytolyngbya sp. HA4215-MV1]|nr:hypothetical protein [Scytolyngbya sp. HA4215-MV1]